MKRLLVVALASLLFLGMSDCNIPWPPNPGPTPTPEPTPEPTPTPEPWACELPYPGCHEYSPPLTCSSDEKPCWHNPTSNPEHCEEAPKCATPEPSPTPPPIPTECTLQTPTAEELQAMGIRVAVRPQKTGRNVSATPLADFGRVMVDGVPYYCTEAVAWPEACAAGRLFGPVAPDGHPERLVCEQYFLQGCGPKFSMAECAGSGNECPITFDPFYVINGVNQNHPSNVIAGCNGYDWEKTSWGAVLKGSFWTASAHGKGTIKACNASESICTTSSFVVDN